MVIYSMHSSVVDPVFYPVVPDSFMTRDSGDELRHSRPEEGAWGEELDIPLVAPHDRWSF